MEVKVRRRTRQEEESEGADEKVQLFKDDHISRLTYDNTWREQNAKLAKV